MKRDRVSRDQEELLNIDLLDRSPKNIVEPTQFAMEPQNRERITDFYQEAAEKYGQQRLNNEIREIYKDTDEGIPYENALSMAIKRLKASGEKDSFKNFRARALLISQFILVFGFYSLGTMTATGGLSGMDLKNFFGGLFLSSLGSLLGCMLMAPLFDLNVYELFKRAFTGKAPRHDR